MVIDMVVEIDGDGSGGTSPSRQGAGTETFCPPNLPFGGGGAAELFGAGGLIDDLGFMHREASYRRRGKVGGVPGGPHHALARPRWTRA